MATEPPAGVREDGGIEGYEPTFVDVDGVRTRHYDLGAGEPLVLLHGGNPSGSWSANAWTRTFPRLTESFRVLAVDRLACGMTDNPEDDADLRYDAELEHALSYLDAVGVEACHLVGFSRGAGLAARMAVEVPDRVRTLGLTNSATLGPPAGDGAQRHGRIFRMDELGLEPSDPAYVRDVLEGYAYRTDYLTDERCRTAAYMAGRPKARHTEAVLHGSGAIEAWVESMESHMAETRRRIEAGDLDMPTLYVVGRNDLTVPLEVGLRAFDLIGASNPRVRLELLNHCGHLIFLEHPREFADRLTRFIDFWAA